jgi:hypothetical protein
LNALLLCAFKKRGVFVFKEALKITFYLGNQKTMAHRQKNLGQSRNRTHVVKPANLPNRGVSIIIKKGTEPITYYTPIKRTEEHRKVAGVKWTPETNESK